MSEFIRVPSPPPTDVTFRASVRVMCLFFSKLQSYPEREKVIVRLYGPEEAPGFSASVDAFRLSLQRAWVTCMCVLT